MRKYAAAGLPLTNGLFRVSSGSLAAAEGHKSAEQRQVAAGINGRQPFVEPLGFPVNPCPSYEVTPRSARSGQGRADRRGAANP